MSQHVIDYKTVLIRGVQRRPKHGLLPAIGTHSSFASDANLRSNWNPSIEPFADTVKPCVIGQALNGDGSWTKLGENEVASNVVNKTIEGTDQQREKNAAAVALGRLGKRKVVEHALKGFRGNAEALLFVRLRGSAGRGNERKPAMLNRGRSGRRRQ